MKLLLEFTGIGNMIEMPRVTLFLLCYKQEEYIEESVSSVMQQDYPNLKIVISDDSSTDNTYRKIKDLMSMNEYNPDIVVNRNDENLGIGRHFAHVMENFVEGELAIACGGDDVSYPNRVSRIVQEWLENGKPSLIAHSLEEIDEQGRVFSGGRTLQYRLQEHYFQASQLVALHDYLRNQIPVRYLGAAIGYRTDTYFQFGTPKAFPDYEDHLMYFRSLLANGIHYFPEVLVKYRRHEGSFTSNPVKRKVVIPSEMFMAFLDNKNRVRRDFVNAYRLHQLATQQWLDYFYAVKNNVFPIDYQVVDDIWVSLLRRHKYLLRNRGWGSIFSTVFRVFLNFRKPKRYQAKKYEMNYVRPFKAILYGAGSGGKNALSRLGSGFDIKAICDSNSKLHGQKIEGVTVVSPQQLKSSIHDVDCILVSSMYFYEIKSYLVEDVGIEEGKIVRLPYAVIA